MNDRIFAFFSQDHYCSRAFIRTLAIWMNIKICPIALNITYSGIFSFCRVNIARKRFSTEIFHIKSLDSSVVNELNCKPRISIIFTQNYWKPFGNELKPRQISSSRSNRTVQVACCVHIDPFGRCVFLKLWIIFDTFRHYKSKHHKQTQYAFSRPPCFPNSCSSFFTAINVSHSFDGHYESILNRVKSVLHLAYSKFRHCQIDCKLFSCVFKLEDFSRELCKIVLSNINLQNSEEEKWLSHIQWAIRIIYPMKHWLLIKMEMLSIRIVWKVCQV